MKKVVILNASPRKDGNISQMLNIIGDELFKNGTEVNIVDVCKLEFRPCIGCMKCRSTHDCVMPEDDAKRILRLVQESDALLVGSPCYWGNMTGQLKMLFDRWVYGMMDHSERDYPIPLLKGKKAVIVTTCTTQWPFNILFKQSAGTVRPCPQGNPLLERIQDCRRDSKRCNPQKARSFAQRNCQVQENCFVTWFEVKSFRFAL